MSFETGPISKSTRMMSALEPLEWSPSKILDQSFSRVQRGCDPDEVESALQSLAAQVDALATERARLYEQLSTTEDKEEHLKEVYHRLKERRQRLDDRRERLDARADQVEDEWARVERVREEVEHTRETLLRVIARLQGAVESERQTLTGMSAVGTPEATATEAEDEAEDSTRDLINSLFPERLAPGHAPEESDAPASSQDESLDGASGAPGEGAAEEQFDRIKADLTGQGYVSASSAAANASSEVEEDEEVSTEELNRIMDVFEDINS